MNNITTKKEIKHVLQALLAAKKAMHRPKMNKVNNAYGSKYADLNEITRVVEESFSQFNLLMFRHTVQCEGNKIGVQIEIIHTDSMESLTFSPVYRSFHKAGSHSESSAETYAVRAAISHCLNLSLDEDTDANEIQPEQESPKQEVENKEKINLSAWTNLSSENNDRVQMRRFFYLCAEKGIKSEKMQRAIIWRFTSGKKERRRDVKEDEYRVINDLLANTNVDDLNKLLRQIIELRKKQIA